MHILIVDDEPANREVLRGMLSPGEHELSCAESGEAALDLLREAPVDLVLLDLAMPGIDGFSVLEWIKTKAERYIPVVVVSAMTERQNRLRAVQLGADDFLAKPVDRIELQTRVRSLLRTKRQLDELDRSENVLIALARTVEMRDAATQDHCDRLATRVTRIADVLGYPQADLRALQLAAHLHDIGKIGIPDAIMLKAGPLTEHERHVMQTHTLIGDRILRPLQSMTAVVPLVRGHHERLDGSGYPDGLKGDAVTAGMRILSVADVFDALTTDRPYRGALPNKKALAILAEEVSAGAWDESVFDALTKVL